MKMYKIQRTIKDKNHGYATGHRYRTTWGRFLKSFELETDSGEKIELFEKQEASLKNKFYRKADRKHNYKMVLADNV